MSELADLDHSALDSLPADMQAVKVVSDAIYELGFQEEDWQLRLRVSLEVVDTLRERGLLRVEETRP